MKILDKNEKNSAVRTFVKKKKQKKAKKILFASNI